MDNNTIHASVATCLVTSHFWGEALQIVSTTATLIATVTGAIIGVVTLWRMSRKWLKGT